MTDRSGEIKVRRIEVTAGPWAIGSPNGSARMYRAEPSDFLIAAIANDAVVIS